MSITTVATPRIPTRQAGPVAYQHRARLLCPACFAATTLTPTRFGVSVVLIPPRPPIARRVCAGCHADLPVPGLFGLGRICATAGALCLCEAGLANPIRLLTRHWTGDWGEIGPEDHGLNEDALRDGARLLSVYHLENGARVWIITEADRRLTTLLLPSEY